MRIVNIAFVPGSRRLTNDEVTGAILEHSPEAPERLLRGIASMLTKTGAETRFWLDAKKETPLDLTLRACREVLQNLPTGPEVTLIIYCGVFEFLREPSSASLLAKLLGLHSAHAFDVKIACAGWMQALEIVQDSFILKKHSRALVVCPEFPMTPGFGVFPDCFKGVSTGEQLAWRFPAYTLGEGATATVLDASENRWPFTWTTDNAQCDACTITAPWNGLYPIPIQCMGIDGPGTFTSYARRLFEYGFPGIKGTFEKSGIRPNEVNKVFTHASSQSDWDKLAESIGLKEKVIPFYPEFGNLVSASLPASIAVALRKGILCRGDKVLLLKASAGMTYGVSYFEY